MGRGKAYCRGEGVTKISYGANSVIAIKKIFWPKLA